MGKDRGLRKRSILRRRHEITALGAVGTGEVVVVG